MTDPETAPYGLTADEARARNDALLINSQSKTIEGFRSLLREAGAATSFMPGDWKQRAKELGL